MSEFYIEFQYKGDTLKLTEATGTTCFICNNYSSKCVLLNGCLDNTSDMALSKEIIKIIGSKVSVYTYVRFCPSCKDQLLNNPEAYVASLSMGLYP
ncbi:MAG: hypothetical protein CMC55_08640 [Flavobacteriaceae bacterium]|nr:hypothetical protein [Flavobacteriaceae bacterium]|tara:strand:- start:866 stop:1153 length:288 start_codon:yes stop_codon:yes gene_type:complete